MLRIPDAPALTLLRDFLLQAGYTTSRLADELGLGHGLYADLSNLQPLLERTGGDTKLAVLARLFFVGWPSKQEMCRKHIPEDLVQLCIEANLLAETDDEFSPTAVITPFENVLIASDAPRLRANNPDVTLGPSATTNLLARAALRTHCESLLDIGTGSGVLAILAADFSDQVIGTDVNEYAITFARFNAALNGIKQAEFLTGDALAPVEGRRFDRIFANPPFFISPRKQVVYSDSPLALDGFTRKLAMEAPHHLKENGVFQMICEWVQVEGEPWEQRLRSWTADSGCDVFVLLGPKITPADYAEKRFGEAVRLSSASAEQTMSERVDYLRQHHVEYVLAGVLTMHKRKGANWFAVLSGDVTKATSTTIQRRMQALSLLHELREEQWLKARLCLMTDTAIEQTSKLGDNGWQVKVRISKTDGIDDPLQVDFSVLRAVEMFDGSRTLMEIIDETAKVQGISPEEAKRRCLALVKRLVQSSFVMPVESFSSKE